ncbi:MAG TPA: response regulator [Candidatus Paceibacterota bacterium]|nr:response regulator [Verrucomicrobiota bacterium]HRY51253.1 response regulator [Candidatus Paceibacterota bacterium]
MSQIFILCVEDEPEVLEAVVRDLAPFEPLFTIEATASADEARRVVASVILPAGKLGVVVCDHIMPGEDGVSFLVALQRDPRTAAARKILLTAHAGLEATVEAVNHAGLNHYVAKPWKAEELVAIVRHQLTEFVAAEETNLIPYLGVLEADRLADRIRQAPLPGDE